MSDEKATEATDDRQWSEAEWREILLTRFECDRACYELISNVYGIEGAKPPYIFQ